MVCSEGHRSLLPIQQAPDPSSNLSRPQKTYSICSVGPRFLLATIQQAPDFYSNPQQAPDSYSNPQQAPDSYSNPKQAPGSSSNALGGPR